MREQQIQDALDRLGEIFDRIEWKYLKDRPEERIQLWPGEENEDVMICVYKGTQMLELFHRQNFFFFNFAYQGDYNAVSYLSNNQITVKEDMCYIGQPYAGYAIHDQSKDEKIIVGVLIQQEAFFKTFFHVLSADQKLFEFFLNPQLNDRSNEYILLKFDDSFSIRKLLDLMIVEFANKDERTQDILRPLTLSLMMYVAKQYQKSNPREEPLSLTDQVVEYIEQNFDHVTLQDVADHFSYHPNYISTLLPKETGKSFSQHVLEARMNRAVLMMENTALPLSEIAELLGYSNSSNFYKAFKEYYGMSPREYLKMKKKIDVK